MSKGDPITIRGQCGCGQKYKVSATSTGGLNEREDYSCPKCGKVIGQVSCSDIPVVDVTY